MRHALVVAALLCAAGAARSAREWPCFRGDVQATAQAWLGSRVAVVAPWEFRPSERVWEYQPDVPVWTSPAIAEVAGRAMVFVGSYDHNIYALDAATGAELWRFATGGTVEGTPAVAQVAGRWLVFVGASDRTCYALDARRGRKVWAREILAWRRTIGRAKIASPAVFDLARGRAVAFSYWVYDKSLAGRVEEGGVKCFAAQSGRLLWSAVLSTAPPTGILAAEASGSPRLYLGTRDGNIYCLNAATGAVVWRHTTRGPVAATPSYAPLPGRPLIIVGDRYGELWGLAADNGHPAWRLKVGRWIDSTAAIARVGARWVAFFGSQDQSLYAVDAQTGTVLWQFETRGDVYSSPVVFAERGRQVVAFASGDDHVYLLDAATGKEIWRVSPGRYLWDYRILGGAVWASPAALGGVGGWLLVVPFYDGAVHAYDVSGQLARKEQGSMEYALAMLRNVVLTALGTAIVAALLILFRGPLGHRKPVSG